MTIIKYKKDNNYCLVQKNNYYLYFLLFINNKYYYYEKYFSKNYNKTYKIATYFLKSKNLEIIEIKIDLYDTLYKMCKFLFLEKEDEDHYCLISETFGDDKYVSFQIYKNNKIIDTFKGIKKSATFLVTYFDYKMLSLFPKNKDFLVNFKDTKYNTENVKNLVSILDEKKLNFYKRYFNYIFYLYQNNNFDDFYMNFDMITKNDMKKFLIKTYQYYDEIIGKQFESILRKFLQKDKIVNDNLNYFFAYFKYYFPFLNMINYLKKNNIKNKKVILHSCLFSLKDVKIFLNNDNFYFINDNVIMREKILFFVDEKIKKEEIEIFLKNDYEKKIKKAKKTFKSLL